ncbi:hypothetical protein [Halobacterium sp. CBA1126]|uniref:hypothetical protein n=1 Tax=Halobacterium sp. CBA1126 TaxID=2668074 RepID=UPI0012F9B0CC|nr:hypothetical protein [Halobacterium sp. CBA1126]MUV61903.1 hypothetical protein [Halobacterium sp. CBA1126]
MPVRLHAEWLTQTDERVLETLDETGPLTRPQLRATLANLSPLLDLSADAFDERCEKLVAHDLLVENDDLVGISTTGEQFLRGDYHLADAATSEPEDADSGYWICSECGTTGTDGAATCPVCDGDSELR